MDNWIILFICNVLSMSINIYSVYKTSRSCDNDYIITYGAKFLTKISLIFEFQRFHKESWLTDCNYIILYFIKEQPFLYYG